MKKLKVALLGAGDRGKIYCNYALIRPEELEIVSVVDTNTFRLNEAADRYGVPVERRFTELDEFLKSGIECDFVVNATMDEMHYETSMKIIRAGLNMILEKPITGKLEELTDIERAATEMNVKVLICHVLRYTPFYRGIKEVLDSGRLGKVMNMQLNEHIWHGHFVNAFVRGKWRSEKTCGSGLLLAKCCHDTDLISWLNNSTKPKYVSSFGSRSFFTEKNAPEGATQYCFECPRKEECMFNAYKFELEKDFIPFYTWAGLNKPLDEITLAEKKEFLKSDVYGQCVYKTDMDIVDRQCVSVEFENGSIATLNMVGGASAPGRYFHVLCEYGEIVGYIEENKYVVRVFDKDKVWYEDEVIDLNKINKLQDNDNSVTGHYGGDYYLMKDAVRYFSGIGESVSVTKLADSINGHLIVYAAETSRKERRIVEI
ncbi:MAG: Gfo/Idh/MocA family oxidoreductase [Clostridia bacterium]|nr:Gfo/Idh/MocA family oxidoreductase [Clostridia bacterium]